MHIGHRIIKKGDIFTMFGIQFEFLDIEDDTIVLRDHRTGKRFIYGLRAFQHLAYQNGYKVKEEEQDGI